MATMVSPIWRSSAACIPAMISTVWSKGFRAFGGAFEGGLDVG
jgi:hypothetical protein